MQVQIQNPNPNPKSQIKSPKIQIQVVEFSGDERLKEAAISALEYYLSLLRDYLGSYHTHREPHYYVLVNGNEIVVRYMRILRTVQYRDVDGKTRRKVEKIYWRVRAHVS
jgi:hypothetical protein